MGKSGGAEFGFEGSLGFGKLVGKENIGVRMSREREDHMGPVERDRRRIDVGR